MGNHRFVVPIPFWLYAIGIVIVAILWIGVIIFVIGAALLAGVLYLLLGLVVWLARIIRGRKNHV